MTPFFYLIYLFTIVYGGDSVDVWVSTDLEVDCDHTHANGCLIDEGIVVLNPFMPHKYGCTLLGHEFYHWLGYQEHEIPLCNISQEFR